MNIAFTHKKLALILCQVLARAVSESPRERIRTTAQRRAGSLPAREIHKHKDVGTKESSGKGDGQAKMAVAVEEVKKNTDDNRKEVSEHETQKEEGCK